MDSCVYSSDHKLPIHKIFGSTLKTALKTKDLCIICTFSVCDTQLVFAPFSLQYTSRSSPLTRGGCQAAYARPTAALSGFK